MRPNFYRRVSSNILLVFLKTEKYVFNKNRYLMGSKGILKIFFRPSERPRMAYDSADLGPGYCGINFYTNTNDYCSESVRVNK